MAKAYWIAHVTVTDPTSTSTMPVMRRCLQEIWATFLARGGAFEQVEGKAAEQCGDRVSIASRTRLLHSAEYQSASQTLGAGEADIVIVEGV